MIELRWFNDGSSKTLQYRVIKTLPVTDYTFEDNVVTKMISSFSDWKEVPEHFELPYKLLSDDFC